MKVDYKKFNLSKLLQYFKFILTRLSPKVIHFFILYTKLKVMSSKGILYYSYKFKRSNSSVALDCEMVGTGPCGETSILGRVSIVNESGEILLDKYVKPTEKVTNYRTKFSGLRPHNLDNGENFEDVQREVLAILANKLLIGHALDGDMTVLKINHHKSMRYDTLNCPYIRKYLRLCRNPSLKMLTQRILGKNIQKGEHDSVEDARAAMSIFKKIRTMFKNKEIIV